MTDTDLFEETAPDTAPEADAVFTPAQVATLERLLKLTALLDVNAARIEQVTKWSHTDESDANEPIWWHAKKGHERIHDAIEILRSSDPDAIDRLTSARRKLVKGLALGLTAIDRIDAALAAIEKE